MNFVFGLPQCCLLNYGCQKVYSPASNWSTIWEVTTWLKIYSVFRVRDSLRGPSSVDGLWSSLWGSGVWRELVIWHVTFYVAIRVSFTKTTIITACYMICLNFHTFLQLPQYSIQNRAMLQEMSSHGKWAGICKKCKFRSWSLNCTPSAFHWTKIYSFLSPASSEPVYCVCKQQRFWWDCTFTQFCLNLCCLCIYIKHPFLHVAAQMTMISLCV